MNEYLNDWMIRICYKRRKWLKDEMRYVWNEYDNWM